MSVASILIFCWFIVVLAIGLISWVLTRRCSPVLFSTRNMARVAVRSLTLSLLFAPTALWYGIGGFPAPASLIIAWYVFLPESRDKALEMSIGIALVCLIATWILFALLCTGTLALRLARDRRKAR